MAVYSARLLLSQTAVSGSKHRGGGLLSGSTVNGRTEPEPPVAGPRLEIAPASTPNAIFDIKRGLQPLTSTGRSVGCADLAAIPCLSAHP
jgi:hypothetical protein